MNPEQMAQWAWSHACEKCQSEGDCEIEECLNAQGYPIFSNGLSGSREPTRRGKVLGVGSCGIRSEWVPLARSISELAR